MTPSKGVALSIRNLDFLVSNRLSSFIYNNKFWSLLLSLTSSIPADACLEILLERRFYAVLPQFVQDLLHLQDGTHTTPDASGLSEQEGPPAKKRRLSPAASQQDQYAAGHGVLLWTALQAACQCVGLFGPSSTNVDSSRRHDSVWTGSAKLQASLLGSLLEAICYLLKSSSDNDQNDFLAGMLNTFLAFWEGGATATTDDERQQAFATHCVAPALSLLDLLATKRTTRTSSMLSKNTLERLIAIHVIFPLRTTFNEQFTKKWRNTADVILYEHMETLLQAYSRVLQPADSDAIHSRAAVGSSVQRFCWILLDTAARSIPLSNMRRRQLEQQFLDTLFIWLVHVTWPQVPRFASTGIQRQQFAEDQDTWVLPLTLLVDVARSRKLQLSPPILTYILQAVLATNSETASWTLVVKVIQLDLDILVPMSDVTASKDFLGQLLVRIESTIVTNIEYELLRDDLILPLMRKYARSRALGTFMHAWQQGLIEAIRVRYISKHDRKALPAVLVWDDDDLFEELKVLSALHTPPGSAAQMLKDLVVSVKGLEQKIGSTAEETAKLAMFTSVLQGFDLESDSPHLDSREILLLLQAAMGALHRKADYQGQRWRIRKLARLLTERVATEDMHIALKSIIKPDKAYLSLEDWQDPKETDTIKQNTKLLEALEGFFLVVDLAAKTPQFEPALKAEMESLVSWIQDCLKQDASLWDGRHSGCRNIVALIGPCVGKLLQQSIVFAMCPDVFETFVGICSDNVLGMECRQGASPPLKELWLSILSLEDARQSPKLREVVLERIEADLFTDKRGRNNYRSLLQTIPLRALRKSAIRTLATAIHNHVFRARYEQDMVSIAGDLDELLRLDSRFPGTFVNGHHWQDWIKFSKRELESPLEDASFDKLAKRPAFPAAYTKALQSLERIFQAIWAQVSKSSKNEPSLIRDILSDMLERSHKLDDSVTFSCLHLFLAMARDTVNHKDHMNLLESIQRLLKLKLERNLRKALDDMPDSATVLKLKLILKAAEHVYGAGEHKELKSIFSSVHQKLQSSEHLLGADDEGYNERVLFSVQRSCTPLVSFSNDGQKCDLTVKQQSHVQQLISSSALHHDFSNEDLALLATEIESFVQQFEPRDWPAILVLAREESARMSQRPVCAIIQASVLYRIGQQHKVLDLTLTHELGRLARLDNISQTSSTGLVFALDNCETVLEKHPLVVNQSVLDGLLAAIQKATSPSSGEQPPSPITTELGSSLDAGIIFERVCAVIGAILSRHRRRLTDRYHLLLPVLQNLLRCLFWPGLNVVDGRKGPAVYAISNFGNTLPRWVSESSESLPLTSADHFSRLLSSICNPTVSAARSSSKRRNELNDEVKKTRKMAGQHMQYIVTEYCRCFLDGQISPVMKDRLMPGMYKVMDAIDRDLMRAMNAGLDPSSRAIFKNLYDDYVKYGKWDKS